MTERRKKAQDRLRRKFKYKTSNNYGRGTILYRDDTGNDFLKIITEDGKEITNLYDISIVMNHIIHIIPNKPIEFIVTHYKDYGKDAVDRY